jgi:hypothetical protein
MGLWVSPHTGTVARWFTSRGSAPATLSVVERLDADLLGQTKLDRDTGTIWFLYDRPLTTREQLSGELRRLQDLGWVERTPKDRWRITSAGRELLSAARDWTFQVDRISHDKEYGRHAVVIGGLLAGSRAYFVDPFCNGFTITRDEAPGRTGCVESVGPAEDSTDTHLVVSLQLSEDVRIRRGDLLRFREQWVASSLP